MFETLAPKLLSDTFKLSWEACGPPPRPAALVGNAAIASCRIRYDFLRFSSSYWKMMNSAVCSVSFSFFLVFTAFLVSLRRGAGID